MFNEMRRATVAWSVLSSATNVFAADPPASTSPTTATTRVTTTTQTTKLVAICADAMYIRGDEQPPIVTSATAVPVVFSTTARSFYGGLIVGLHW